MLGVISRSIIEISRRVTRRPIRIIYFLKYIVKIVIIGYVARHIVG